MTRRRVINAVCNAVAVIAFIGAAVTAGAAGLEPDLARSAALMWFLSAPLLVLGTITLLAAAA